MMQKGRSAAEAANPPGRGWSVFGSGQRCSPSVLRKHRRTSSMPPKGDEYFFSSALRTGSKRHAALMKYQGRGRQLGIRDLNPY